MANRLEAALAQHLGPVAAPEDLWLRIEEPRQVWTSAVPRWSMWAFAAAVAATVALFCFSLARGVDAVPSRPADPAQNSAWVQPNANHTVPARASMAQNHRQVTSAESARAGCVLCHS